MTSVRRRHASDRFPDRMLTLVPGGWRKQGLGGARQPAGGFWLTTTGCRLRQREREKSQSESCQSALVEVEARSFQMDQALEMHDINKSELPEAGDPRRPAATSGTSRRTIRFDHPDTN